MSRISFWQSLRENGGLLTWKGRIKRSRFFIVNFVINMCYEVLDFFMGRMDRLVENTDELTAFAFAVGILVLLALFIMVDFFNISKRFHDIGHPTVYAAVFMFIIVALEYSVGMFFPPESFVYENSSLLTIPVIIYLIFKKGVAGPNQYGQDPLASKDEEFV